MENKDNDLQNFTGLQEENNNKEAVSIPVIHENIIIDKRLIETGRVRILKKVDEQNELVNIPLEHEEIDVQTFSINQYVDDIPAPVRYEGDTMIIPVLKEVSVVRVMLEKEIHVTKRKVVSQDSKTISLRKEEILIENIPLSNHQGESH